MAPPEGSAGARRGVLAVTALGAFLAFLDATIVNIAFPDIRRSFPEASNAELSWVLNAYNVVFAAGLLPAGRLADLLGRRRLFFTGLLVFTLASLLCSAAPSPSWLIAARVVQAVGAALLIPASLALLLPEYPAQQRITAVALLGAAAAVAAASGPPLGGVLIDAVNWRLVFLINAPLALIGWLVGRRVLREHREGGRLPDLVGVLLLALAVGLLALGIVQTDEWGWGDPRTLAALGAAPLVAAVFLARTRGQAVPAVDLSLFANRTLRIANGAILVFAASFYAKILCDVLFLTAVWDYSLLTAGLAVTPGPLVTAVLAAPAGRLAERIGPGRTAALGAVVYTCACLWYVLQPGPESHYLADWLPGTFMTGLGIALAFPTLTSAAVVALPPERYGTGSALNATARQLGAVLGVALLVAVIGTPAPADLRAAFDEGWIFCAVAAALSGLVAAMLALGRRRPALP